MVPRIGRKQRSHLYIEQWMEARGLSDQKMADRIGVERPTVTRWRRQQHRLNPEKIAAIAAALDIEPAELWRPPSRPSVDALLRDADDDMLQRAAEVVRLIAGTKG
jgi:transcriptional regulator with XRE-family HTH domain